MLPAEYTWSRCKAGASGSTHGEAIERASAPQTPVEALPRALQDYFLSEVKVEPLMVVGFEGLFGVAAMAVILAIVQFLPGQEGTGLREDSVESWQMIRASPVRVGPQCRPSPACWLSSILGSSLRKHGCAQGLQYDVHKMIIVHLKKVVARLYLHSRHVWTLTAQ